MFPNRSSDMARLPCQARESRSGETMNPTHQPWHHTPKPGISQRTAHHTWYKGAVLQKLACETLAEQMQHATGIFYDQHNAFVKTLANPVVHTLQQQLATLASAPKALPQRTGSHLLFTACQPREARILSPRPSPTHPTARQPQSQKRKHPRPPPKQLSLAPSLALALALAIVLSLSLSLSFFLSDTA